MLNIIQLFIILGPNLLSIFITPYASDIFFHYIPIIPLWNSHDNIHYWVFQILRDFICTKVQSYAGLPEVPKVYYGRNHNFHALLSIGSANTIPILVIVIFSQRLAIRLATSSSLLTLIKYNKKTYLAFSSDTYCNCLEGFLC